MANSNTIAETKIRYRNVGIQRSERFCKKIEFETVKTSGGRKTYYKRAGIQWHLMHFYDSEKSSIYACLFSLFFCISRTMLILKKLRSLLWQKSYSIFLIRSLTTVTKSGKLKSYKNGPSTLIFY